MNVFEVILIGATTTIILLHGCTGQNTQNYTYTETTYTTQCQPYQYRNCTSLIWGMWSNCTVYQDNECTQVPVTVTKSGVKCADGWTGSNCSVAICSSPCPAGQSCSSPNKCSCLSQSVCSSASIVQCSQLMDCYPGTCINSGSCACPAGFSGQNCQTLTISPTITNCRVQLSFDQSTGLSLAPSTCSAANVAPVPAWLGYGAKPSEMLVEWTSSLYNPVTLPYVSTIQSSPIGVTNVKFTVDYATSSYRYMSYPCATYAPCTFNVQWSNIMADSLLTHNQTITVTVQSQSGGQKNVTGGGSTIIDGPMTTAVVQFKLDQRSPTHCLSTQSDTSKCPRFPIYLEKDITTDPVIRPRSCSWTDDGSGIRATRYELFYMQPATNGLLQEIQIAEWSKEDAYLANSYQYSLTKSGVYALHLTVFDQAQNYARARKIILYSASSWTRVNSDAIVRVDEASPSTNWQWINRLPKPTDSNVYRLTVVWEGRYQRDPQFSDDWLRPVDQSTFCQSYDLVHPCYDDVYGTRYGFRTVSAVRNTTGILQYGLAFSVDSRGGAGVSVPPPFTFVNPTQERKVIEIPVNSLKDGDTVVFWLSATDLSANSQQQRFQVSLDRTLPVISSDEFLTETTNEFTSSFVVNVVANYSGIKSISYSIIDTITKLTVYTSVASGLTLPMTNTNSNRRKRDAGRTCPPQGDSTCYCISTGTCYPIRQAVDIDNCNLDRYLSNPLQIQYTVTSQAANNATGQIVIKASAAQIRCRPPDDSRIQVGAIIGIVIGVLLFILILVIVALMLWRWKRGQHPVPQRVRSAYENSRKRVRNRLSVDRSNVNPAYSDLGPIPPVLTPPNNKVPNRAPAVLDNDYETVGSTPGRGPQEFQADQVHYEKLIAGGKFADISSGWLKTSSDSKPTPVAIKALKRGHTASDVQIMREKIRFFVGLLPDEHFVRFVGYYNTVDEGPVMLFELGDMSLKTWLSEVGQGKMVTQVLDDMYTFALNIAQGVEYLHSKSVVHRRLRCGNVVLKKQQNGMYVAKLIGFGPSADAEVSASDTKTIPVRWLAPETLSSLTNLPVYNKQTDVWSYAVTVWEIYSKGGKPYERSCRNADDLGSQLNNGLRLDRPEDCPRKIYDEVLTKCWNQQPSARPDFTKICRVLIDYRAAQNQGADYYPVRAPPKIKYDSSGMYAEAMPGM